ncbi:hypothetical protein [Uliginosibacterium gangwonense]|uniref:hypothetical protein n=1 Tax=Uliginosibacterium gangwonense TaxID=392736 RepID=UPI0012FA8B44|nr:hypothetical protein [Uliginosibacterium gangwonense]
MISSDSGGHGTCSIIDQCGFLLIYQWFEWMPHTLSTRLPTLSGDKIQLGSVFIGSKTEIPVCHGRNPGLVNNESEGDF